MIVYVDGIVILGNDTNHISELKVFLGASFQTKNLGPLKYFLGIEISRNKKGIFIVSKEVLFRCA